MADLLEEDPTSGIQSSEEVEEEEEEEEIPVESLVRGRAKRSTAGRHMSALLEAAADDDLALLFEEVEDDNEFADLVDPDAEDDVGLESSDDEDDQGPNAQNDYEGEQQLQKEERKKRKTQNDLKFQTLRKRVKIDPTAVSSMPAAPRPKKKSERISWIPTTEDGPTRQSSRRQTMVNKELTHARLKDSQEKRVRIIATMKEAEKRKAHLKPKAMTQEDHLAEAARIERLNSKSLNRWELSEKRKADERRARIEALQNRRLDGPVISYWSGVATFTNGRLTRVGTVDIKPKPDKEEARKRKKEKEDKEKAAADLRALQSAAPIAEGNMLPPATGPASAALPATSQLLPNSTPTVVAAAPGSSAPPDPEAPSDPKPFKETIPSENATVSVPGAYDGTTDTPVASEGASASEPSATTSGTKASAAVPPDQGKESHAEESLAQETSSDLPSVQDKELSPAQDKVLLSAQDKPVEEGPSEPAPEQRPAAPIKRASFAVEITVPRHLAQSSKSPAEKPPVPSSTKTDEMEIDSPASAAAATKGPGAEESMTKSQSATPDVAGAQPNVTEIPKPHVEPTATTSLDDSRPIDKVTPIDAGGALAPHAAPAAVVPTQATLPESALPPSLNQPFTLQSGLKPPNVKIEQLAQPEVPPPPPIVETAGRTLTILENFDYATAQKPKYSMYFNAKKPPRLTKISSSLCVITSLPSRYRDPETGLPYANSYAYGQIRRLITEGYIWSAMLGCFVGPAEAARGVPERFSFASKHAPARVLTDRDGLAEPIAETPKASAGDTPSTPTPATKPPQAPQSALSGEPMKTD
ncbi:hypothetical protein N7452_002910 [Penicillium brevicompactum]|uniref:Vps72/YL1 C-terminal domain-containing protein n=1 Tax=Penicillium brevicompactum TaxID=5074 RepID=A0A9W9UJN2_PENBR|nr:hypothetical protein N7452_002910 [Penicillium brevicompactum]